MKRNQYMRRAARIESILKIFGATVWLDVAAAHQKQRLYRIWRVHEKKTENP